MKQYPTATYLIELIKKNFNLLQAVIFIGKCFSLPHFLLCEELFAEAPRY